MKTVGEIIRTARQKRGLSIEQLSVLTKIDGKYISALEADHYQNLPSETFIKGFIRNIAQRLSQNPDELIAIFRRDFRQPDRIRKTKFRHRPILLGLSLQILPFILGALVFVVYLVFQFRAILTPPKLEVVKPTDSSVLVSPIIVEGSTSIDSTVYINEDTLVKPDSSGRFTVRINLPVGEVVLKIKSVNRFSRTSAKEIPITIISK